MDRRTVLQITAVLTGVFAMLAYTANDKEPGDGAARSCSFQYEGARTARDTAAADRMLAWRRWGEVTCGTLRKNGTLARYEARRAARTAREKSDGER